MKTPIEEITEQLALLHAKQLLLERNLAVAQAESQGARIQYQPHESGKWIDTIGMIAVHVMRYRIKPEPRVRYAHDGSELLYLTRKEADYGGLGRVIKFVEEINEAE